MNRVLIIDDHPVMRMGLVGLLGEEDDLQVVCQAGTAAEALAYLDDDSNKVELVLLDLALPDRNGLELMKDMLALRPGLRILVVSSHDEKIYAERVLRGGARGYIMKEEAAERLIAALRAVLEGEVYVSEAITGVIVQIFSGQKSSSDPTSALTDRELEVFTLVGEGKGSKAIGEDLGISARTVDAHRTHIREKLGYADAKEMLREAVRWLENQRPG